MGRIRSHIRRNVIILAVLALVATACSSASKGATSASGSSGTSAVGSSGTSPVGLSASAPGITKDTINIGIVADITGAASSNLGDEPLGEEAVFKQANANGGVDGRQIVWSVEDDTSTPAGASTAEHALVQTKNVFLVTTSSAVFFGGAPYLQQAGVPVIGAPDDGVEWFKQPNTNMFSVGGNSTPDPVANTSEGQLFKLLGKKKISWVVVNIPSAVTSAQSLEKGDAALGESTCDNLVFPFGVLDFTSWALSFKAQGCDTVVCDCVTAQSLAVDEALKNQGLTDVPDLWLGGQAPQILNNPAQLAAAKAAVFNDSPSINWFNDAGKATVALLQKYDPNYTGGIPDQGTGNGVEIGNLVLEALQVAGKNPTRQSLINNLRQVTGWTDNGLAPAPVSFQNFGQNPPERCGYFLVISGNQYVPYPSDGSSICGKFLP